MKLELQAEVSDLTYYTIYWDDTIVCCSDKHESSLVVDDSDGWHSLILESTSTSNVRKGSTVINTLTLDNTSAWPITDLARTSPPVPFCLSHGYFYSAAGDDYITSNEIFNNSLTRIYFLIKNKKIVDHYYDRGDETNLLNRHSVQNITDGHDFNISYHLRWSDVYDKFVHRLVFVDHCLFYANLKPTGSTYMDKWFGVKLETTDSALAENLARSPSELAPIGSDFVDAPLTIKLWPYYHVFGSYCGKNLPPELFDFILEKV